MFRRRRGAAETPSDKPSDPTPRQETPASGGSGRESGPWDSADSYPQADRVDLGGLHLPIGPDFEVQLQVAGEQIVGALVLAQESALQLHAFAAPKKSGLWDDLRVELSRDVEAAKGTVEEREGPFGTELHAHVPQENGQRAPIRYIGVDGPRWFLRAVITGRAAVDPNAAAVLEGVVREVVVVRGDEPMAPREGIALQLPPEARQALEEQADDGSYNPYERGPEITETR
ncbi:DUF3710 domain-containing protein [Herbidospora cretacea]|uniref:DUF3710 domain-containing protein n=1 Tax=Herbidospora cretacea TaxID=28444 RepID=UPI0007730FB9|nr:DUF3710 domain-containing protein [Herbidospora cretacea]